MKGHNPLLFPSLDVEKETPLGFSGQTGHEGEETPKRARTEDGRGEKGKELAKRAVLFSVLAQLGSTPAEWHWLMRQTLLAKGSRRLDHYGANIHLDTG